ncbi:MAG: DUF1206 domain-containing protein [Pyrinomonadaceae bacterium]|nr:DUF1206 domain-containing protein [Pyrinomonadaceae bacterium]
MNAESVGEKAKEEVKQVVREARPWVIRLGRLGFAAIGIVYILVGILAAQAAIGAKAAKYDAQGVLYYIAHLPFGQIMLVAVAVGLVCHALWRLTQALMDTDRKGSEAKGVVVRAGFVGIALFYFGLAFSAVKIVLGARNDSGFWAQSWTAWLLAQPFGQWLVALVGAIITISGVYFFYQAYSTKFRDTLLFREMSERQEIWGTRFGRFGFAARGVVFCIIGFFLAFAAWHSDAGETRDFGAALRVIEQQSYGAWLLGVVAVGLFSYGIFMLFLTMYRRMVSS